MFQMCYENWRRINYLGKWWLIEIFRFDSNKSNKEIQSTKEEEKFKEISQYCHNKSIIFFIFENRNC